MRMTGGSVGAMASILMAGCAAAPPRTPDAFVASVDEFVAREMQRQHVPGAAIAVVRGGEMLLAKGYGFANLEHRVPVTDETVFQSASLGKQFTAVAVMLQVEAGTLALDDPIAQYFQDAPASWRAITVRHLLTHTSGIADYYEGLGNGGTEAFDDRRDYTEEGLRKEFYGLPLEFEPGTRWHYCNTGYVLLGFLVRRASGGFYADVLKERVFTPLGMTTARIISEEEIVPNRAAGYRLANGEIKNQEWYAPSVNTTADGSLYLTLRDLLAWDRGLRAQAVLTPPSWAQVYAPVTLRSGATYPYGFGWRIDQSHGMPQYHHSGHSQGFAVYISRYLADDLTIVVLTNLADADPSRLVDGIAAIIDPTLAAILPSMPIPDTDPTATERVRELLALIASGRLSPGMLLYGGRSVVEQVKGYAELLHPLGAPRRLIPIDRRALGDDHAITVDAIYPECVLRVYVVQTPEGRVSDLDIQPEMGHRCDIH